MQEPIDLAPELAHQQRIEELKMMAEQANRFFPCSKYEIKDILMELNMRLTQYKAWGYSFEFRILQSIQDFQNVIKPLQVFKQRQRMVDRLAKAKVDFTIPVAQWNGKMIWVSNSEDNTFSFIKPSG